MRNYGEEEEEGGGQGEGDDRRARMAGGWTSFRFLALFSTPAISGPTETAGVAAQTLGNPADFRR